jgi:hypothetical protein
MGIDAELFVRTERIFSEQEIRRLGAALCAAFGVEHFYLSAEHHALELLPLEDGISVWRQDGEPIVGVPGEFFIQAHLYSRYYSPNYERGNWPLIRSVAEWMESHLEGTVWYGGDSSGVLAEPLDSDRRDSLNAYFIQHGHDPYTEYFTAESPRRLKCDYCGGRLLDHVGGGLDRTFWKCSGCGIQVVQLGDALFCVGKRERALLGFEPANGTPWTSGGFADAS